MKMVTAVIKPFRLDDVREALAEVGKITEEELAVFKDHPKNMEKHLDEIASYDKDFPQVAPKIVGQHHERPNGMGHPRKLRATHIVPLASLFIVVEDMVHNILESKSWSINDYVLKNRSTFQGGSFSKVMTALGKVK